MTDGPRLRKRPASVGRDGPRERKQPPRVRKVPVADRERAGAMERDMLDVSARSFTFAMVLDFEHHHLPLDFEGLPALVREEVRSGFDIPVRALRKRIQGLGPKWPIKPYEREILGFIIGRCNAKWRCSWWSTRALAEATGKNRSTTRRARARLVELGLLERVGEGQVLFDYPTIEAAPHLHAYWTAQGVPLRGHESTKRWQAYKRRKADRAGLREGLDRKFRTP